MNSTLNRRIAPVINPIRNIHWPQLEQVTLGNGVPVTIIRNDDQPIVQVELLNNAGRILETTPLAARTTASMLKEGAGGQSGQTISERVDYYGGSLVTGSSLDIARAQLFTLSRYEEEVIPYLASVWLEPDFPEEELLLLKQNRVQKLKEDLRKPDNLSYRAITEHIFGSDHPYGYNSTEEMYRHLSIEDIRDHYQQAYGYDNMQVIITGQVSDRTLTLLDNHIGTYTAEHTKRTYTSPAAAASSTRISCQLPDSYQTGIKIGRRLFNRQHTDYPGLFVLNVILGGYFGSRLMSSIREDLGYTYNIYSSMGTLLHDGFYYISTEVDPRYAEATIAEIYRQINRLQTEPIPLDELHMVRNYILGHMLGMLDGPFNIAQLVKSYKVHGVSSTDFAHLKDVVTTISPEELQRLAQRYLQKEDMVEVVVG